MIAKASSVVSKKSFNIIVLAYNFNAVPRSQKVEPQVPTNFVAWVSLIWPEFDFGYPPKTPVRGLDTRSCYRFALVDSGRWRFVAAHRRDVLPRAMAF